MNLHILLVDAGLIACGAYAVYATYRWRSLRIDPTFKILSRPAVERQTRRSGEMVFLDLDNMRTLNSQLGYQEVDRRIRESMAKVRTGEVIPGRWYSGDEIVLFCGQDEGLLTAKRLSNVFRNSGLTATMAIAPFTQGDWRAAVKAAADRVQMVKKTGDRGSIYWVSK